LEPSDADLVRQCLRGDNQGFDCLVKKYECQIAVFCYHTLGNTEAALDAAQETFVKAYRALTSFRQDARFLTWLYRIATNSCIDAARRSARDRVIALPETPSAEHRLSGRCSSAEDIVLGNETSRQLRQAVAGLPVMLRLPLVMFHYCGMSIREISQSLRRSEGTVKSDLHSARDLLRARLRAVLEAEDEMQTGS
jgi:RNA polymerase sigma-70 factor, ECF subfamily